MSWHKFSEANFGRWKVVKGRDDMDGKYAVFKAGKIEKIFDGKASAYEYAQAQFDDAKSQRHTWL